MLEKVVLIMILFFLQMCRYRIFEHAGEVLRLLAMGYANQEIADELDVSVNAVRFHLNNLHTKTGCSSRTELAIAAARSGIAVMGIK